MKSFSRNISVPVVCIFLPEPLEWHWEDMLGNMELVPSLEFAEVPKFCGNATVLVRDSKTYISPDGALLIFWICGDALFCNR